VKVRIDEAGQHGPAAGVDLRVRGTRRAADRDDVSVLDMDCSSDQAAGNTVEDGRVADERLVVGLLGALETSGILMVGHRDGCHLPAGCVAMNSPFGELGPCSRREFGYELV
jgi:hypothetical protein